MATIKGTFESYISKPGVSKTSGKPYHLYSIVVDGTKYGFGFNPPKAAAGDVVTFNAETNERGYLEADPKSFKTTGERDAVTNASNNSAPNALLTSGLATMGDPRQGSIEIQSSIASASRIIAAQINAGVAVASPAAAVGALVQQFLDLLHPKPKAAAKPKPAPVEDDDDDSSFPA